MADMLVTQADDGKELELSLADVITLHLPENPTTGYRWALEETDGVTLETSSYAQASHSAVGGGGERTFKLRPLKTGDVSVRLKRWREWEGDASITETFQLKLQVH
jgi:inhibitor of cysteine peptidase